MRTPISNLLAAHHAVLQSAQDIGLKGVEVATRFFELQTQATQGMLAAGNPAAHGGMPDPLAMARGTAEYTQRAMSLSWQTHAEMTQLVNQQASQLQTLLKELLAATLQIQAHTPPAESAGPARHQTAREAAETI